MNDEQDDDDVDGSEDVKFGTGATGGDVMDSYESLAWEQGGAGHNAAESSGHSAPRSRIMTTTSTTFLAAAADQYEYAFPGTSTCPANGYISIKTAQECSQAAVATSHNYAGSVNNSNFAGGCNVYENGQDVFRFIWNEHTNQSPIPGFSPVCKCKLFRTWSSSDYDCVGVVIGSQV